MDLVLSSLRVIGNIFLVLMVFNLMIVVHEWGHFLAARWRGLKVEAFQIWFGKPIWKKTINGVQYGLGCIPATEALSEKQSKRQPQREATHDNDSWTLPARS